MSRNVILYHANCMDGFGAAWAAYKKFGSNAVYVPVNYGDPIPPECVGNHVFLVDFSFKRPQLERLLELATDVMIFDHHKTAWAELEDFHHQNLCVVFDMDRSGAVITWEELLGTKIPELLLYIQDRDLWKFELEGSKEYSAALWSYPLDFTAFDRLSMYPKERLISEGHAILRYMDRQVEAICARADLRRFGNYVVPVVNATTLFSEVGHHLCKMYPGAAFSVYWFQRSPRVIQYGLRSIGDFDVSAVAASYGGGGHKNAAGCESYTKIEI